MLIKWIKKKVLKSIINDLKKEMPHLKEEALKLLEVYKDELSKFYKKNLQKIHNHIADVSKMV